jgi:hypothetical protein
MSPSPRSSSLQHFGHSLFHIMNVPEIVSLDLVLRPHTRSKTKPSFSTSSLLFLCVSPFLLVLTSTTQPRARRDDDFVPSHPASATEAICPVPHPSTIPTILTMTTMEAARLMRPSRGQARTSFSSDSIPLVVQDVCK